MITLLTGDNDFDRHQALRGLVADFDGSVERIDGESVELKSLPDLLMGGTLFAEKRLVIISQLSEQKLLWADFAEWLPRLASDIHLVLVEPKPDKRTKTYKAVQKIADVKEFKAWTDRDRSQAEQWTIVEATRLGMTLERQQAQLLVSRAGVDQWALHHALQKLAVLDIITTEHIIDVVDATPSENVFDLFEAALNGHSQRVGQMIATLSLTEDAYRLFGLLSGQMFQLAALAVGDVPSGEIAKVIGAHPFALSKLTRYASKLDVRSAQRFIEYFADADSRLKTSATDPWLIIESTLQKIATQP